MGGILFFSTLMSSLKQYFKFYNVICFTKGNIDQERASRMARFDGFEQTAYILGNALSPLIFTYLGFQGAFG